MNTRWSRFQSPLSTIAALTVRRLLCIVATYGDAANTVYLDPSWEVWRDEQTGAACGFKESQGYALAWGRPLCDDRQLRPVLDRFLEYLRKSRKLKPIFACIDETTEQMLAKSPYNWRSLAVAAEERIDPTAHNPNNQASRSNLGKKIKQAQNQGVKAVTCDGLPEESVRKQIDARMQEWKSSREGKQMHTTDLLPWDDAAHRRYFYATDKQGKVGVWRIRRGRRCVSVLFHAESDVPTFLCKCSLQTPRSWPSSCSLSSRLSTGGRSSTRSPSRMGRAVPSSSSCRTPSQRWARQDANLQPSVPRQLRISEKAPTSLRSR